MNERTWQAVDEWFSQRLIGADERLDTTAVQTVGSKGRDGFAITIVGA
ncbi:hypothetical protein F4827_002014 [Paraburkholderia bannensis]|uniref:Uncharacterized protein n=1 Tax=Paraburkholderia bannensis TaxID=765414 RepID=A0A7W9WQJ7_9BURK|nr:hypothetical protein [Paraburkholderia sp. WP4_3_2]MBB6102165.1 hypothetical protein [Paraburkholderia bannensis]